MRILLLRTWLTNIGNGFIDKGARAIVRRAFPDAEIIESSGYGRLAVERRGSTGELSGAGELLGPVADSALADALRDTIRHRVQNNKRAQDAVISVADLVDVDIAVLPGCVLYDHGIGTYWKTLQRLNESGVPIILLGAGGGDYDSETNNQVTNYLGELNIGGLITRDSTAYDCYADWIENTHDGIDCAFFIDEWYEPPTSNREFVAATFDKKDEPSLRTNEMILRPDHAPFGSPLMGIIPRMRDKPVDFEAENVMISELLEDYLFVYANAKETHADRIHACVPALVYGNKARFYYRTPRGDLFDKVLTDDIKSRLVQLEEKRVERLKTEQVEMFARFAKKTM